MNPKLTLEQFREIKNSMLRIIELSEQSNEETNGEQIDEEKLLNEYKSLQDKLLSSDLSDIPFEEWEGLTIFSEGELDLSKTHANIDFSLLAGIDYESINIKGCNIKGLEEIEYNESMFDDEFIKEHPEYFPDKSLPEEIRQLYFEQQLSFSNLFEYPSLRKNVNKNSFSGFHASPSSELVKTIGFENAIRFFDEYPEFISKITYEEERYSYNKFSFRNKKSIETYEDAKQFVYNKIIEEVKESYSMQLPPIEIIPQEMIDKFPNIFLKEEELPEKVIEDYYTGNISVQQIRQNSEVLKNKDIRFATHSSTLIRNINTLFGDVWKFIENIPQKYSYLVERYISSYAYRDEELENMKSFNTQTFIANSIKNALDNEDWFSGYYLLEEMYDFSQYVPIKEIFKDQKIEALIQRCGFKNLVEFNKKNNRILEMKPDYYSSHSLLNLMAENVYTIEPNEVIDSEEQLFNYLERFIHEMRKKDDYYFNSIFKNNKKELSSLFPKEFLDYDMLDDLLKDVKEEEKKKIIDKLEVGFNGKIEEIFEILNKYPFLIDTLADKNLIVSKNHWAENNLFEALGSKRFLEVYAKYGSVISRIISEFNYNEIEINNFVELLKTNNYEEQMNKKVFDILGKPGGDHLI